MSGKTKNPIVYTENADFQSLVLEGRYSETQHAKRSGGKNTLGFTRGLVLSGFYLWVVRALFCVVLVRSRSTQPTRMRLFYQIYVFTTMNKRGFKPRQRR